DVVRPLQVRTVALALAPCEHRTTAVGLGPEVGGQFSWRQRAEPDHLASRAKDFWPAWVAATGRGDEDIAVAVTGAMREHPDGRRLERGRAVQCRGCAASCQSRDCQHGKGRR